MEGIQYEHNTRERAGQASHWATPNQASISAPRQTPHNNYGHVTTQYGRVVPSGLDSAGSITPAQQQHFIGQSHAQAGQISNWGPTLPSAPIYAPTPLPPNTTLRQMEISKLILGGVEPSQAPNYQVSGAGVIQFSTYWTDRDYGKRPYMVSVLPDGRFILQSIDPINQVFLQDIPIRVMDYTEADSSVGNKGDVIELKRDVVPPDEFYSLLSTQPIKNIKNVIGEAPTIWNQPVPDQIPSLNPTNTIIPDINIKQITVSPNHHKIEEFSDAKAKCDRWTNMLTTSKKHVKHRAVFFIDSIMISHMKDRPNQFSPYRFIKFQGSRPNYSNGSLMKWGNEEYRDDIIYDRKFVSVKSILQDIFTLSLPRGEISLLNIPEDILLEQIHPSKPFTYGKIIDNIIQKEKPQYRDMYVTISNSIFTAPPPPSNSYLNVFELNNLQATVLLGQNTGVLYNSDIDIIKKLATNFSSAIKFLCIWVKLCWAYYLNEQSGNGRTRTRTRTRTRKKYKGNYSIKNKNSKKVKRKKRST